MPSRPPRSTPFPTRRSSDLISNAEIAARLQIPSEALDKAHVRVLSAGVSARTGAPMTAEAQEVLRLMNVPDRKSTRLNSSHVSISYAVFCLKKKTPIDKAVV